MEVRERRIVEIIKGTKDSLALPYAFILYACVRKVGKCHGLFKNMHIVKESLKFLIFNPLHQFN